MKAIAGATTTNLVYDPLGRLFETNQGTSATTTRFLTDGDAMVLEYNSANDITHRFVHGSNVAADDPLVWYSGSNLANKRWLHADHLGSIVAWTNSSGGAPTINKYDEYGLPAATNTGRFQYTGQAWIGELGLYYYKARFYHSGLGRFMQTDPVGYRDNMNLYAYVEDDPVNKNDPSGNCAERDPSGECVVRNRAGKAGEQTAAQLQAQVRKVDHAIRSLDPKARLNVNVGGGKTREMSGAEIAKTWSKTTWAVDPAGTKYASGFGAQMDRGRFSGAVDYLQSYRITAERLNRDPDEATKSVVLHDFGHSTRAGRDILRNYLSDFDERERATSRLGQSIGNLIGESFQCSTFELGC